MCNMMFSQLCGQLQAKVDQSGQESMSIMSIYNLCKVTMLTLGCLPGEGITARLPVQLE